MLRLVLAPDELLLELRVDEELPLDTLRLELVPDTLRETLELLVPALLELELRVVLELLTLRLELELVLALVLLGLLYVDPD